MKAQLMHTTQETIRVCAFYLLILQHQQRDNVNHRLQAKLQRHPGYRVGKQIFTRLVGKTFYLYIFFELLHFQIC